jgi:hypothetical protein
MYWCIFVTPNYLHTYIHFVNRSRVTLTLLLCSRSNWIVLQVFSLKNVVHLIWLSSGSMTLSTQGIWTHKIDFDDFRYILGVLFNFCTPVLWIIVTLTSTMHIKPSSALLLENDSILLLPAYRQKLEQEAQVPRSVQRWSDQSDSTLQDCFDHMDWDMFLIASDKNIDE